VRGEALESIENNFIELGQLFDSILQSCNDSGRKAKVNGVKSEMSKFKYYFGARLGIEILSHTDNLSRALQNPSLSAAEAHQNAKRVISVLNDQRSDAQFDLFWNELNNSLDAKKIDEPAQERKRKHREFFGEDSGTDYLPNTVKGRFKMAYMEAFDHVILQITSRFE
jgi:hypothetical protein